MSTCWLSTNTNGDGECLAYGSIQAHKKCQVCSSAFKLAATWPLPTFIQVT